MTRPNPPIAIEGPARLRPLGDQVEVSSAFVTSLASACHEVVTDDLDRAEAGRDWWPLALHWALDGEVPAIPAAVARPASVAEVAATLRLCHEHRVPLTAAGGRSGVCGASIPVHGGVVLDMTAMAGITDVDDASLTIEVAPGTFGDAFEAELASDHGLTVGHWPQSMALSTVGGWLACRGAGQLSTRYGKIEDMVVGLDVALADGSLLTTGGAPRGATGPDLTQVFVGSEGTLGVITSARLRAHPAPGAEARAAFGFESFAAGMEACRLILRRGATPAVLRLYDPTEGERSYVTGDIAPLLVLDQGDPRIVEATLAIVEEVALGVGGTRLDSGLVERWWAHRNDVSALAELTRKGIVVDTMEVAGPWSVLPAIYADVIRALGDVDDLLAASAHQSHAYGDGACLYFSFAGRPPPERREAFYIEAWNAATGAVLAAGGVLSHHHGVGLNRGRFMAEALGGGFDVLCRLKNSLDPHGVLNPGKLGLPSPFGPPAWPSP